MRGEEQATKGSSQRVRLTAIRAFRAEVEQLLVAHWDPLRLEDEVMHEYADTADGLTIRALKGATVDDFAHYLAAFAVDSSWPVNLKAASDTAREVMGAYRRLVLEPMP